MEGRGSSEVLREGTTLRGNDIIPELLLIDGPAPVSYNRFQADVPLDRMSAREISRRIELLTGYSTERLQELVREGSPLEGHRLYMLAHLLITKANKTPHGQGVSRVRVLTAQGLSVLILLMAIALSAYFASCLPFPKLPIPEFELRFSDLTNKFPQQKPGFFDSLETKLSPVVNQGESVLLAITGPSPTARAMAESLPWVLSKSFVTIDPLQFGSLAAEHRSQVIADVMKAWSDRPDDVLIFHEPDKLPPDVLEVVVEGCRTAMSKNGVIIATGERPGTDLLAGCGKLTGLQVTRETGLAQPSHIMSGDLEASISTLKKTFPSQSERLWQLSDFVISNHLQDGDPRQPSMLILAGLPGANRTVNHLAEDLARIYTENPLVINSRQFSRVDPDRGKLHLDRALDSAFRAGRRAAVLTELDSLPSHSAMMLHSYCDHDNAQFKDVAYFMTLQLRESADPNLNFGKQDKVVRDHLREAWATLGQNKRNPLISRIATMIVLVQKEERFDKI